MLSWQLVQGVSLPKNCWGRFLQPLRLSECRRSSNGKKDGRNGSKAGYLTLEPFDICCVRAVMGNSKGIIKMYCYRMLSKLWLCFAVVQSRLSGYSAFLLLPFLQTVGPVSLQKSAAEVTLAPSHQLSQHKTTIVRYTIQKSARTHSHVCVDRNK